MATDKINLLRVEFDIHPRLVTLVNGHDVTET